MLHSDCEGRTLTILAVCGLKREAEIAGVPGVVAVAGGGDAAGLTRKLGALHGDITGVISIGLGGALSPHLKVGAVVIGERVLAGGEIFRCDNLWRVALAAKIPGAQQGPIAGSDVILESSQTKSALFQSSGALVVDMESQAAARFAAARGLKLAVLRVISDDVTHTLPPAALVAMTPDGGIAVGRVLWSLAKNPLQLGALIRTGHTSKQAFAELLRCRDLLGAGLGGVGLAGPDL
jgi:adenosylhomocysteine nucleosidase